jgi:F-type H+-transporting ATPase subunit epsilon
MHLKILLPFGVFADIEDVKRVTVETDQGSFGLLPQRLDCVAAIVPSILLYQRNSKDDAYFAVDAGVLVKTGIEVLVSVRHAIASDSINQLRNAVEKQFIQQSTQEKNVRSVLEKMESNFIRRLVDVNHDH